jgi:hypothetical protein
MKARSLVGVCIWLLFATGMASTSFANVQSFVANVFGTPMGPKDCDPLPAPCEFLLSGALGEEVTYVGFKIKGVDQTHPAKIVASEADKDKIVIQDAIITATVAGSGSCTNTSSGIEYCPSISYSAFFAGPPSTAGGNVTFVRSIAGTFKRGTQPASLSAVKVRGAVSQNLIGSDGFKKICSTAGCENLFSAAGPTELYDRTQVWYQGGTPALPDPRELSGQMWVYAKYGSEVLTATAETVKNPTGGGGPPPPDCAANKKTGRTLKQCKTE